ncbi:hypothetical protein JRQ81_015240 [Phrynocephalus forsythii]|uniref:Uncharacterized protein n=1 Tax=Phrynocephalus forsythii TaxID=171643 RepID=A0A9Q0XU69_9SAUR|nr:hypothetical protein JRQ81_015240 [Phrynocephalus forsythii]
MLKAKLISSKFHGINTTKTKLQRQKDPLISERHPEYIQIFPSLRGGEIPKRLSSHVTQVALLAPKGCRPAYLDWRPRGTFPYGDGESPPKDNEPTGDREAARSRGHVTIVACRLRESMKSS